LRGVGPIPARSRHGRFSQCPPCATSASVGIDGNRTGIDVTSPTGVRVVTRLGGPDVAAKIWDVIEKKRGEK
jgi:hypothetical protein